MTAGQTLLGVVACSSCEERRPCPVRIRRSAQVTDHLCETCWVYILVAAARWFALDPGTQAAWIDSMLSVTLDLPE
jgi:hypothetical protein